MRVYFPATFPTLEQLLAARKLSAPRTGLAVTAGFRAWYTAGDEEELEYAATAEAARASLRLLDADDSALRRRVVLAADVSDCAIEVRDDIDRGVVRVTTPVPMSAVGAVLIDEAEAEPTVAAAAAAIVPADLGDRAAEQVVDDAEGFELSWYATQEIAALLASTGGPRAHGSAS